MAAPLQLDSGIKIAFARYWGKENKINYNLKDDPETAQPLFAFINIIAEEWLVNRSGLRSTLPPYQKALQKLFKSAMTKPDVVIERVSIIRFNQGEHPVRDLSAHDCVIPFGNG